MSAKNYITSITGKRYYKDIGACVPVTPNAEQNPAASMILALVGIAFNLYNKHQGKNDERSVATVASSE